MCLWKDALLKVTAMSIVQLVNRMLRKPDQPSMEQEIETIYRLVYDIVHDLDASPEFAVRQTERAFDQQWGKYATGHALLSDEWFKENVDRILSQEEIQIRPEWFRGRWVLDAGCGNGRWSYGFAKLGANVTLVDTSETAIETAKSMIESFRVEKEFYVSSLENLGDLIHRKYDLVFCWGVLHHCRSFNKTLNILAGLVDEKGLLYLYLYGRESLSYDDDIKLFRKRLYYNTLPTDEAKHSFLLKEANKDASKLHNLHDLYAPLINRRLEYSYVKTFLEDRGFDVTRTIDSTELFLRAMRTGSVELEKWSLPKKEPPYWFYRYR